jgi:hypothetical protein
MKFQAIFGLAFLAPAFCGPALAEDCGPLKLITGVQMLTSTGSFTQMVPVTINGVSKLLLLDTGGFISQLSPDTVKELQMERHDSAVRLYDVSGNESRSFVIADSFKLGSLVAQHQPLMVSTLDPAGLDGLIATDLMLYYDIDIDFGTGSLRYFSQDHCQGKVLYWAPPAVAAVPITIEDRSRIMIPVKLDGREFKALVDTGATRTTISLDTAKREFDLTPDSPGMTKADNVNGDPKLASYTHVFHTLNFNGIDVTTPRVDIMPDRVGSKGGQQQTGNRALLDTADLTLPQLILGMDIMRHLHVYMAFKEKRFYVSIGSEPREGREALALLDQAVALSPSSANLLNSRCFARGLQKVKLDEALQDCDLALKTRPSAAHIIDSKGLVLYQLGRYQDALDTYNEALKIAPQQAASLFMRGHAKQKLGDAAGGAADIAAAKTIDSAVMSVFEGSGIGEN